MLGYKAFARTHRAGIIPRFRRLRRRLRLSLVFFAPVLWKELSQIANRSRFVFERPTLAAPSVAPLWTVDIRGKGGAG
jgi:hypothetical protein